MISRDWDVTITHVFREANACADKLTHLVVGQDEEFYVFEDPPTNLGPLLLTHAMDVTYSR